MGLTRRPDWRGRLARYLAGEMRRPFAYGTSDCALFAADAVLAMTGTDPAAAWRGRYTTLRGGLRVIRKAGHADHIAAAAAVLEEVAPGLAMPGDLAVVAEDGHDALGVVHGATILVRVSDGLGHLPRARMLRAFRCG